MSDLNKDNSSDGQNEEGKKLSLLSIIFRIFSLLFRLIKRIYNIIKPLLILLEKHWRIVAPVLLLGVPIVFISLYLITERTEFPELDKDLNTKLANVDKKSDIEKGAMLSFAIRHHLGVELDTFFGWTINDLPISPTKWLDNRNSRQEGVIYATKMFESFFATNAAKYGRGGEEHAGLKAARDTNFAFEPYSYMFPSSEAMYRKGLQNMMDYERDLLAGKAVFNFRTDDIYKMLKMLIDENFLGEPLGRLRKSTEDISFFELDNTIYYTQGVILVVRDVLRTLILLYPELLEKGGTDNIERALLDMDKISTFNPIVVLGGKHDSMMPDHRSKVAKYLYDLNDRLREVAESINR